MVWREWLPKNFNLRISLHSCKIQFRILLKKKKKSFNFTDITTRSYAVYSNIKFPIILSINYNLLIKKNQLFEGKKEYDIRTKRKEKKINAQS